MKPMKSKVSITLDEDIIIKIKELSENDDRSFSQYKHGFKRIYFENGKEVVLLYILFRYYLYLILFRTYCYVYHF